MFSFLLLCLALLCLLLSTDEGVDEADTFFLWTVAAISLFAASILI